MKHLFYLVIISFFIVGCNKNKECEPIQVNPGDTIVFKHPNIPDQLHYKDADITFYQPHTDSIVITYKKECN
jgi:uncharacterized protein YcfL